MKGADGIGNKKGYLFIQFPGKISIDYSNQIENILEQVQQLNPQNEWKIAIEFRNPSWNLRETHELLDNYHASLVLHDLPKSKNFEINQHAPFVYIRLHGSQGDYRYSYNNQFLETQFQQIKVYLKSGKHVYVYFNNTIGNAFENASHLKLLMQITKNIVSP